MKVLYYYQTEENNKEILLNQIQMSSWEAGIYLYKMIKENRFKEELGEGDVLILHEHRELIGYCTISERDCIESTLSPWIGFLFIKEEYRGKRLSKLLIDEACKYAHELMKSRIYLATSEVGLYEKYGFKYLFNKIDKFNSDERVYYKSLTSKKNNSYKDIELTGEDIDMLKDRKNKKEYKNVCDTHWDGA